MIDGKLVKKETTYSRRNIIEGKNCHIDFYRIENIVYFRFAQLGNNVFTEIKEYSNIIPQDCLPSEYLTFSNGDTRITFIPSGGVQINSSNEWSVMTGCYPVDFVKF